MRRWIFGCLLLSLFLAATVWAGEPALRPWTPRAPRPAGELLVKFKPGSLRAAAAGANGGLGVLGVVRAPLAFGPALASQAAAWQRQADVEWAQPNEWRYALVSETAPNDPYYAPQHNDRRYQQWYLPKINANFAWSVARGDDAIVAAVVDSGVDLNHPDLRDRLLPGITIVNQDKYTPPDNRGMDDNGHGTHVAGLIGAATNNGKGIAGCSWSGKLLPVKVLNSDGEGTDADIAAGILWAADAGARIINLSLGGTSSDNTTPQVLQDAVNYAQAKGCLVIAAAGNSGDQSIIYPAALPHVLAVAATDASDRRASYSTMGAFVALAAPGGASAELLTRDTGILSTYWDANSAITDAMSGSEAGEYAIATGTSMAAGIVSGAALVLWSHAPSLTADQVADLLKSTAVDLGTPGPDQEYGNGRIDLLAALGNPTVDRPVLTLYSFPNPFNPARDGFTRIVFLLDRPVGVKLRIYDVSRDLVWQQEFAAAETLNGKNVKTWDGRNGVGETVANGAYFLRLTTDDGRASATKVIGVLR